MPYKQDRERVDPLMPQVRTLLSGLPLAYFAEVQDAPLEVDRKQATDMVLRITGGDIAARLRFPPCDYRDLTLRAQRDNGAKTELAKIREGFAYRYFYGWVNELRVIAEWILVDLNQVRGKGLLGKERRLYPNRDPITGKPDGTHLIALSAKELHDAGCLIAYHLNEQVTRQFKVTRQVNTQASLDEGIARARNIKCYTPRVEL